MLPRRIFITFAAAAAASSPACAACGGNAVIMLRSFASRRKHQRCHGGTSRTFVCGSAGNQATSLMTQLRYFGIDVAGAGLQRPRVTASSRVGAFWRCWALHALPLSKPVPWQGSPGAGIFPFMLIMPYSAGRFCRSRPVCSRSHSRLSSTSRIRAARSLWLIGFCSTSRFGSSRP